VRNNPKRFESCSKPDDLPYIWLLKPPAEWVDPVSLEKRGPESIPYNDTEISATSIFKYIKNNLPDYTQKIETVGQHNEFKESMLHADINKVLFISNKERPSMEMKAIAQEYKDRLMFGFVPESATQVQEIFKEVNKRPEIILYKSYDSENDQILNMGEMHLFNESLTYPIMKEFLD